MKVTCSCLLAVLFCLGLAALGTSQDTDGGLLLDDLVDWDGEELARVHCVTCHVYPEPGLLPRQSWPYLLNLMGLYFGYDDGRLLEALPSAERRAELFDVHRYPQETVLSPFQWAAIRDFYESARAAPPVDPPPVGKALDLFSLSLIYGDSEAPVISLAKAGAESAGFLLGDANERSLLRYTGEGKLAGREELPGAIVQLQDTKTMQLATVIGRLPPSNDATGSLQIRAEAGAPWRELVADLHRPVNALAIDFDLDGVEEILVNEFGHYIGGLSLIHRSESGEWEKQHLRNEPGSISAQVWRWPTEEVAGEVLVLNAQARQDITLYRHLGDLHFEARTLLTKPPSFGYTQLHVSDLDGNGGRELITVNGDNADLPGPPLKAYHGIRIYRMDEDEVSLEELAFLPVPGAFQAAVGDFDQDGLEDIAVVSFFPDSRRPTQRFVLFRNTGDLGFERLELEQGGLAPWMTLGAGDIDGDGDLDIVLGTGYVRGPPSGASDNKAPQAMILRNRAVP